MILLSRESSILSASLLHKNFKDMIVDCFELKSEKPDKSDINVIHLQKYSTMTTETASNCNNSFMYLPIDDHVTTVIDIARQVREAADTHLGGHFRHCHKDKPVNKDCR